MDKKENDIDSKELNVNLEESTLDLKAVRESRGLTLKDLSFSTRVSYSNLKAIEEQKFKLLPEPIYARAFIGAYAGALDIDGKKILSLYDKYLEGLEPDENEIELLKKLARKKRHTGFWIWLAIVSCVIALIGVFFLYQWNKDGHREMKDQPPVGEIHSSSGDVSEAEKDSNIIEEDRTLGTDGTHPEDLSAADGMKDTGSVIEEDRQPEIEGEQPKEEVVSDKDVA
ncbi:MAG: helix-turn-helix domain-containing protein, partial [Syntrophobacterales bacterium]|nr:helix-turn-helix domain-containing protein [Syntrophobacterales bacterium]